MVTLDLQYILILLNFFLLIVIFFYAFYLYRIEKKVKQKYADLTNKSQQIIEEANKKAVEILQKSEFISENLKGEITNNFEAILSHIKTQNADFYKEWQTDYLANSEKMIEEMKEKGQLDLEKISNKAIETQETLETKLGEEFNKAKSEIDIFKSKKEQEYSEKLSEAIKRISKEKFYVNLPLDIHKKIVVETVELALKEVEASTE
ncbi:MAG: hypothetical protein QG570_69 [Patescibacteria group bacterium]|nr:hypothetical protein [Patescibacteria group bacterium]